MEDVAETQNKSWINEYPEDVLLELITYLKQERDRERLSEASPKFKELYDKVKSNIAFLLHVDLNLLYRLETKRDPSLYVMAKTLKLDCEEASYLLEHNQKEYLSKLFKMPSLRSVHLTHTVKVSHPHVLFQIFALQIPIPPVDIIPVKNLIKTFIYEEKLPDLFPIAIPSPESILPLIERMTQLQELEIRNSCMTKILMQKLIIMTTKLKSIALKEMEPTGPTLCDFQKFTQIEKIHICSKRKGMYPNHDEELQNKIKSVIEIPTLRELHISINRIIPDLQFDKLKPGDRAHISLTIHMDIEFITLDDIDYLIARLDEEKFYEICLNSYSTRKDVHYLYLRKFFTSYVMRTSKNFQYKHDMPNNTYTCWERLGNVWGEQ